MTRRLVSLALAAMVGAMALGGCAGQSKIYNSMISSGYRPYLYGYGAGRRDLTTIVRGNPFDLDQEQMETRLLAKLNARPTLLQPTHFTTTPGPSARPEFKAVLLFNRAIVLPNAVCRAPDRVPALDLGPTMRLTATFCRYGGYLTTVTGELENVTDVDDPRIDKLIGQIVPLLFPPIDPTEDENGGMRFLITRARDVGHPGVAYVSISSHQPAPPLNHPKGTIGGRLGGGAGWSRGATQGKNGLVRTAEFAPSRARGPSAKPRGFAPAIIPIPPTKS